MILRIDRLGLELPPPTDPDPAGAQAVQELLGGRYRGSRRRRSPSASPTSRRACT
jgi:hypothetical protein